MTDLPNRKRLRLPHYDYNSNGVYFVTFCVHNRKRILSCISVGSGDLDAPQVRLTDYGKIVENNLLKMEDIYKHIHLLNYVIMPDHVHLLLVLEGCPFDGATNKTLSAYIGTLKRFSNKQIGKRIWQRGFYDHIIRNDTDLYECYRYIEGNPSEWIAKGKAIMETV